jgi:hypothetical protein
MDKYEFLERAGRGLKRLVEHYGGIGPEQTITPGIFENVRQYPQQWKTYLSKVKDASNYMPDPRGVATEIITQNDLLLLDLAYSKP